MTDQRRQRIETLTAAARAKSDTKIKAARAAIKQLIKRGEAVTFQAVQYEAGVSHNFLYTNAELRAAIEHHRSAHRLEPKRTASAADADNNLVIALTTEINRLKRRHKQDVSELRAALEQAHGDNLALRPDFGHLALIRGWAAR